LVIADIYNTRHFQSSITTEANCTHGLAVTIAVGFSFVVHTAVSQPLLIAWENLQITREPSALETLSLRNLSAVFCQISRQKRARSVHFCTPPLPALSRKPRAANAALLNVLLQLEIMR